MKLAPGTGLLLACDGYGFKAGCYRAESALSRQFDNLPAVLVIYR